MLAWGCKKKLEGEALPELMLEQYFPSSGKAGTLVRIIGSGFALDYAQNTVLFAGKKAEIVSVKSNEIVVLAPLDGNTGEISLKSAGRDLAIGTFTYQSLSVQALSPARSQAGAQISIKGEGFSSLNAPPQVFFGEEEAAVISASDTLLVVEVPLEGSGVGAVRVLVDGMESEGPNFSYMNIYELRPLTGGAGTRIRIIGEGFGEALEENQVSINGKAALVESASAEELVVIAPEGVESGDLNVNIGGEVINGPEFTVVPFPEISTVSPLSGPAGVEMRITGDYFSAVEGETSVFINGTEMELSSVSATEIRLVLPGGTGTGEILVSVNDQETTGPEFKDQALGISSMSPDNTLGGYEVSISGSGFSTIPTENFVSFNGSPAEVLSATETSLVVRTPLDLTTGVLRVQVGDQFAEGPTPFRKAGVESYGLGSLQISTAGGSLAVDDHDNIYVLEIGQHRIVKIQPDGTVQHFAGSSSGIAGYTDGMGGDALFSFSPNAGLVFDSGTQMLYVSDPGNRVLRQVNLSGEVSTLLSSLPGEPGKMAGQPGKLLITNGSSAFTMWQVDIASKQLNSISVTHYLGFLRPGWDPLGSIYSIHINVFNASVSRSQPSGASWNKSLSWAGKFAKGFVDGVGAAAQFGAIAGYAMGDADHLLILDPDNYALRKANIHTAEVTTVLHASPGFADGLLSDAKFSNNLKDLYVGKDGAVYILDCGNNVVRKVML